MNSIINSTLSFPVGTYLLKVNNKTLGHVVKSVQSKQDLRVKFYLYLILFKMGFTPCRAEQPLRDMELQEKEAQKG